MIDRLLWLTAQHKEYAFHKSDEWRQSKDFMEQTAYLFDRWGLGPDDYMDKTVIDIGAGSKLRTKYFNRARLVAVEPLADRFKNISWSDVHEATVYPVPAEQYIPELNNAGNLVVSINVLDHCSDPEAVIRNMSRYMNARNSKLLLSFDMHDEHGGDLMHPSNVTLNGLYEMVHRAGLRIKERDCGIGKYGPAYGNGNAVTVICKRCDFR